MPDRPPPEPLRAHAWVVPALSESAEPAEDEAALDATVEVTVDGADAVPEIVEAFDPIDTHGEFAQRVRERVRVARYVHSLKRVVHSPSELARGREIEQSAAVWVPILTFAVTAVCAVIVVLIATTIAGRPDHGLMSDALVAAATVGFLVAGFSTLDRSQDYFDARRPGGRLIRTDLADAYETVRDGAAVLVELGVPPAALSRVADLLPQAERLVDFLVQYEAGGGVVRRHPAYDQLILMGAEVTVLTDMAEERLGRRSSRRRDRQVDSQRVENAVDEETLTPFDTLADLVAMLGPDLPGQRFPTPYGR
ncbi:hypothetical protein [Nocardioides sp. CER19]|uniref:hypothetical protein n=1 Tax=Nocardioides sp. CER19 TaxID=3038538 RepID=UPI00244B958C|nr:hypothetical protein [Nocardioides sp. CER19]MDH2415701.1 hypothetical protein [Nocardioides sp. CER19]